MESFFSRFKNALVLIAILLAQTIALATQINRSADPLHPDGTKVRLFRLWTLALMTPFERISAGVGHGLRGAWGNYVNLHQVRQQNADLSRQVAALRMERARLTEDALEGKRLRGLLGFQQGYAGSTVVAQVIGTSGSETSHVLILNKGARAGLRPDMAVMTPDGVVGKLRDVFPNSSQLLLLSDSTAGAGVILSGSRIHATIRGNAQGRVQILNLTPDSRIKVGEEVVTSGGDRVFPRGLPVGKIESIVLDPEHQPYTAITIRPAANLTQLEEVLVVTSLGTEAQEDASGGAAVHAADVSADRLPSVHDGEPAASVDTLDGRAESAPPADDAKGLVPKPKPALHPDRFSPGETLPAAELTPGSPKPKGN